MEQKIMFTCVELCPISKNKAFFGGAESSGKSRDFGSPQQRAVAAVSFMMRRTFKPAIVAASKTPRRCTFHS
jgi:hypothetical protein